MSPSGMTPTERTALREAVDLAGQLFAIELLAAVGVAALDPEVYHRRRGPNRGCPREREAK